MNSCNHKVDSACPFSFTERSEIVQNYGCLPSPYEIVIMRQKYKKTWACHEDRTKPCIGAINYQKDMKLDYNVLNTQLVTEQDDFTIYCK